MPRSISEVNALRNASRAAGESQQSAPNGLHGGHYDPNEPRVPAGQSGGGRWTNKAGSGAPTFALRDVTVDRTGEESWGSFANGYRPDGSLAEQRILQPRRQPHRLRVQHTWQ